MAHRWTDEAFVREDLESLSDARAELGAARDGAKMLLGDGTFHKRRGEFVRCGDRVLNGEIDAHATDRRHRMRGISDAQKPGARPALQSIHRDGKQLNVVPVV